MSTLLDEIGNRIETTFQQVLASALDQGVYSIRLAQENNTGKPLRLPAVVLTAKEEGVNYTLKANGHYGSNAELRAECRVDGTLPQSADSAEALGKLVHAAITQASTDIIAAAGWLYVHLIPQPDENTFEGDTRVLTRVWKLVVLAAV